MKIGRTERSLITSSLNKVTVEYSSNRNTQLHLMRFVMRTLKAVIGIGALLLSWAAQAGVAEGTVSRMYVHGPNSAYSHSQKGVLMFMVDTIKDNANCAYRNEWAVSLDSQHGRAIQETLETAQANDLAVRVVGAGDCHDWLDRERPVMVSIERPSVRYPDGSLGDTFRVASSYNDETGYREITWEPVLGAEGYSLVARHSGECFVMIGGFIYGVPGEATKPAYVNNSELIQRSDGRVEWHANGGNLVNPSGNCFTDDSYVKAFWRLP